jgi:5-methylcytosine-specific restriction protein A
MKIEPKHWEKAYELGRKVYVGELRPKDAKAELVRHGLNLNSAGDFIYILRYMLQGKRYARAMSTANTDDFLTWIRRDDGEAGHARAVEALRQHLEYYTGLKGDKLASHREVLAKHEAMLPAQSGFFDSPEEIPTSTTHLEGKVRQVLVNTYERNPAARAKCIAHHGATCSVCAFDFGKAYGKIGEGFIHVHHLKELSSIAKEYEVDPIEDLRPVCPNCHAMLHTARPALTIANLRQLLKTAN